MILEALISARAAVPPSRLSGPGSSYFNHLLEFIDPFQRTVSGVQVSDDLAWNSSCFYCGVQVIADGFASSPPVLYRKDDKDDRIPAVEHHLFDLVRDSPNPEQTSFTFLHTAMVHQLSWGNFYAEIERDRSRRAEFLWPLSPDRVKVRRVQPGEKLRVHGWDNRRMTPETGRIIYEVRTDDHRRPILLDRDKVFHPPGLGFNGLQGFSVLRRARESLGIDVASQRFVAAFFGNHAVPAGFLNVPEGTDTDAEDKLILSLEQRHENAEQAHRLGVLPAGVTFQKITTDPVDALMMEVRRFTTEEWARWLNIPIHFLKDLTHSGTRANVTQETLSLATHTIRPWHVRFEQEFARKLLTVEERKGRRYYFEARTDSIVRSDLLTRYKAMWQAVQGGWMSVNDVRKMDNRNGIGPQGDIYRWPVNSVPAEKVESGEYLPGGRAQQRGGSGDDGRGGGGSSGGRGRRASNVGRATPKESAPKVAIVVKTLPAPATFSLAKRLGLINEQLPAFADAFARMVAKEVKILTRLHVREGDPSEFAEKVGIFYDDHLTCVVLALKPHAAGILGIVKVLLECKDDVEWSVDAVIEPIARLHCNRMKETITEGWWTPWDGTPFTNRGLASAEYALSRLHNAAVIAVCRAKGLSVKWVCSNAIAEPLIACGNLIGKVVRAGDRFTGELMPIDDRFGDGLRNPPLDFGCKCQLEVLDEGEKG